MLILIGAWSFVLLKVAYVMPGTRLAVTYIRSYLAETPGILCLNYDCLGYKSEHMMAVSINSYVETNVANFNSDLILREVVLLSSSNRAKLKSPPIIVCMTRNLWCIFSICAVSLS